MWECPRCSRKFRRTHQRHSCGVGSREAMLEGKAAELVRLYGEVEKILHRLGDVEIVARDRYALFRTTRIFADLVFMKGALRLALMLKREASSPIFFKVLEGEDGQIAHVTKIHTSDDLRAVEPYLVEAHHCSIDELR